MRFPEFKDEWKICTISDFGKIITGNTPSTKDTSLYGEDYLWASPADLGTNKFITETNTKLSQKGFEKTRKLPKDSILVTCIGSTIGKMGMASRDMATNQQINAIIVNNDVDCHFAYYAIQSRFPKYMLSVAVQAVPIISKSNFEKLRNYRPTTEEQNKIGALLSLIDKRIELQRSAIEKLKSLKSAIREKQFKQIIKKVDLNYKVSDVLRYEQPIKYIVSDTEYSDDKSLTPVLTANQAFILGYTDEKTGVYSKGHCIIIDDFTLDCKYVDFAFKVKSSAIKILTANDDNLLRYLYEYLKFLNLSSSEHKRHYISEIEPMKICLPDEDTILKVASLMKSIDKKIESDNCSLNNLINQKKYLLSKMFI